MQYGKLEKLTHYSVISPCEISSNMLCTFSLYRYSINSDFCICDSTNYHPFSRDIEDQMEAVWQSANSENVRLKDEVQKSVHQLRKHAGLSEALDAQEKVDNLSISSDEEHEKQDVP